MSESQFGHMSLDDLRVMLGDVLASRPDVRDADFLKALVNEIAKREKAAKV